MSDVTVLERIQAGKFTIKVTETGFIQVFAPGGVFLGDCLGTVRWELTPAWARLWLDTSANYIGVNPSPERRAAVEAALLAGEILAAVKLLCESEEMCKPSPPRHPRRSV